MLLVVDIVISSLVVCISFGFTGFGLLRVVVSCLRLAVTVVLMVELGLGAVWFRVWLDLVDFWVSIGFAGCCVSGVLVCVLCCGSLWFRWVCGCYVLIWLSVVALRMVWSYGWWL